MSECIDDFDGEVAEEAPEVSEEAPLGVRCNRRLTHKQVAHIPGPRRQPNFLAPEAGVAGPDETESEDVRVPKVEGVNVDEEIDGGAATAEPESVSEETLTPEKGHEAPQPGGLQKPMTFGSIDK